MTKRGQIGEIFKYILIVLVAGSILLFGYKAFVMVKEKGCLTEIADFEADLKGLDEGISFGTVLEKTLLIPCSIDEIYFVDLSKNINLDIFNKFPLIKDSIDSGLDKNVFLVKGDEVKSSFFAGNMELSYPYFECLMPMNERIDFFLEGKGRAVEVIPGCEQAECSYDPVVLDGAKEEVLLESISFREDANECDDSLIPNPCDVDGIATEAEKAVGTSKNVDIFRKYKYCPENGNTTVEILIRPKENLENFRFFENIPKGCINDLVDFVFKIYPGALFSIQNRTDPLIMWYFSNLPAGEEQRISYEINKKLDDLNCREVIEGIGIAERIGGTDSEDEADPIEIPPEIDTNNNPPVLSLNPHGDQRVGVGTAINIVVSASDVDVGDSLTLSATGVPPGATWTQDISPPQTFSWTPTSGDAGEYEIEFTVADRPTGDPDRLTDDEEVEVEVINLCTPLRDELNCKGVTEEIWWFDNCNNEYEKVIDCNTFGLTCRETGSGANCYDGGFALDRVECGSGVCQDVDTLSNSCNTQISGACLLFTI